MQRIVGVAQHYAWGDPVAIPSFLGVEPDGRPWAEWWLGTHHGGPATLDDGTTLEATAGPLPYLCKVLSAAEPLSLQTHPGTAQAERGFEREEAAGVPLDAPERTYRDPFAKPEIICALTPFDALCGFRPLKASDEVLRSIGAVELADHLADHGLAATVEGLYRGWVGIDATLAACAASAQPAARLAADLAARYPGDASVVVALLLNRVRLQPGQALYLGPGNLHAYLSGVGVEVMGASDNVVRGGMTPKHVDVDELLRTLKFAQVAQPVLEAQQVCPRAWRYPTPNAPFVLWRFDIERSLTLTASTREVLLCVTGDAAPLHRGQAAYLAPGEQVTLAGPATVFRVTEATATA